jgi:pilus assembly protein CpaB
VRTSLTSQASHGTLQVRPGFRALSIDVDAISGLEGHALPGTHVDVLLTFLKDEVKTTKILVQNARVLSYGGVVENDLEAQGVVARAAQSRASLRRRALSSSITLEVGIKDALKIQTARQMGKLGLMMRPQDDSAPAPADITYMDRNDVAGGDRSRRVAKNTRTCTKGRIRVSGQEYMLGCDGTLSQVLDPYEP